MTLQELSSHIELKKRLEENEEILMSLKDAATRITQNLTGMPHNGGSSDKVGNLAVEITDMETRIEQLKKQVGIEENEITVFIDSIEDEQTRLVFRLRFIHCLKWREVAEVIGGGNNDNTVRKICYRYLGHENDS